MEHVPARINFERGNRPPPGLLPRKGERRSWSADGGREDMAEDAA